MNRYVTFFKFVHVQRIVFGNNEPGAVGTTLWWPPGIALQKRRFSKKDGNIKRKNPCLDVCSKPDGKDTIGSKKLL